MKCDELKAYKADVTIPVYGTIADAEVYLKKDVDSAIDELKSENERLKDKLDAANNQCENLINSATDIMLRQDKANDAKRDEIESLKATHYAEMVDAGMRERRLKRALYKACANWADVVAFEETEGIGYDNSVAERWRKMERKCIKKAEEYK